MSYCCYGTSEYAHLGWPKYSFTTNVTTPPTLQRVHNEDSAGILTMGDDTASAVRRLLEYLNDEPEEAGNPNVRVSPAVALLTKRAEELRREAAGISLVESRAKRIFAADILDRLISELSE